MLLTRLKLTCSLALLAFPLGAQPNSEHHDPLALGLGMTLPVVLDRPTVDPEQARTVSAELLRYPLSAKVSRMLQKALRTSEAADHSGAIQQLRKTLAKFPGSGAYAYSLLGVEYLKTGQIPDATDALERAVKLLPHDASNHANLGLSLVLAGQYDRAKPELQRSLKLDPHNVTANQLLNVLALSTTAAK